MKVQQNTYSKGDWIVHAHYGVGQVRGIEKKEFNNFSDENVALVFLHILQGLRCRILKSTRGRELDNKTRDGLQQEMITATEIFINGIKCKRF